MWEQIRSNKRRSVALVFVIALLLLILGFVIGEAVQPGAGVVGICVAVLVWMLMSVVAYFQGDNILLAVGGAKEIAHEDHPQLFNVVEEMQIAAGLPKMPRVYLVDDMALNAFATGRKPDKAAVAITTGLLGRVNRDELQGVIAHEMSHIVNRDVLLMTIAGVMLGTIVMIAEIFLRGFLRVGSVSTRRYRSERGGGGGQAQLIMVLVAVALAILAPILAQLIYFAISRRREYLADANAAVLTRYPEGLASALEVIAADANPLTHANRATAPMYIINPLRKDGLRAFSLTSTHPPTAERIRILRTIAGNVSFQQYDTAWRAVRGRKNGIMPPSALAQGQATAIRAPHADAAAVDPRQRLREAGDLLRKTNQFRFLPCACGLRIKLPPDFSKETVPCPRCHRELTVPTAQLVLAGQVADVLSEQTAPQRVATPKPQPTPSGDTGTAVAPLQITRCGNQWMSFKCTCGATLTLSPFNTASDMACSNCGRKIVINTE
jgi:heat shock protein HtpX